MDLKQLKGEIISKIMELPVEDQNELWDLLESTGIIERRQHEPS